MLTALVTVLIIHSAPSSAIAQNGFSFRGKVLDTTGAPIVGAHVATTTNGRTTANVAVTDQTGEFTIALPPGRHDVTVESDGFIQATLAVNAREFRPLSLLTILALAYFVACYALSLLGRWLNRRYAVAS